MPWKVSVHSDPAVIETRYAGAISPSELQDAVRETLELAKAHASHRFLSDCEDLIGGHSVFDLYFLADALQQSGITRTVREAVLLPGLPEPEANVRFWETTARNRGIDAQLFVDRASALAWLLS